MEERKNYLTKKVKYRVKIKWIILLKLKISINSPSLISKNT